VALKSAQNLCGRVRAKNDQQGSQFLDARKL